MSSKPIVNVSLFESPAASTGSLFCEIIKKPKVVKNVISIFLEIFICIPPNFLDKKSPSFQNEMKGRKFVVPPLFTNCSHNLSRGVRDATRLTLVYGNIY